MFLEDEDWNDDKEEVLSPAVSKPKESSSPSQTKAMGKKSLLRTLQTLGTVPDWRREDGQTDSDSETETPPTEHAKKKRKKKRRKRKHAETTGEQTKDGDLSQRDTEDAAPLKKKRKDKRDKKRNPSVNDETTAQETSSKPAKGQPSNTEKKLSRQQWKNRIKHKKKCNNKYKPQGPAEGERKEKDPNCNITKKNSESKEVVKKKGKKEKRKISEEVTVTQSPKEEELIEKKNISEENRADDHQSPVKKTITELNRKLHLKKVKLLKLLQKPSSEQRGLTEERVVPEKEVVPENSSDLSASLRSRMEQRLESARFRYINEVLYSTSSGEAKRMFTQDPQAFWVYHRGYSAQVQRWPTNPVDDIIHFIRLKPPSLVVADFGCGDCKIARSVKNKVYSFDLVATCDLVTACDMANVPLKDSSVDIAVFCLSLMGTNLGDFLKEANRVLKMGGFLKIAEVSSRFDNVRSFITALANLGFKMVSKDTENTHFYAFELVKTGPAPETVKKFGLQLKPCLYKKR